MAAEGLAETVATEGLAETVAVEGLAETVSAAVAASWKRACTLVEDTGGLTLPACSHTLMGEMSTLQPAIALLRRFSLKCSVLLFI